MTPGLTLEYTGKDNGHSASWTRTWDAAVLDDGPAIRMHAVETSTNADDSDTCDEYYRFSGGLLSELQERTQYTYSGGSTTIRFPSTLPAAVLDQAPGWSRVWTGVPVALSEEIPGRGTIAGTGVVKIKISVAGIRPVRLSNGLYFSRALVIRNEMWLDASASYDGRTLRLTRHGSDTAWFVQGLGEVKYAYSGSGPERRELSAIPAWTKYLTVSDGILHVPGTSVADTITFAVKDSTLTCYRNGVPDSVPLADIRGVVIDGLDGNDVINASKLSLPVTISGGAGDDSIIGGRSDDSILAGEGNDTVRGGNGNDTLSGGSGSDLLVGSAGTNRFEAADGAADILDARGGRDNTAIWDSAQDQIRGKIILS